MKKSLLFGIKDRIIIILLNCDIMDGDLFWTMNETAIC